VLIVEIINIDDFIIIIIAIIIVILVIQLFLITAATLVVFCKAGFWQWHYFHCITFLSFHYWLGHLTRKNHSWYDL